MWTDVSYADRNNNYPAVWTDVSAYETCKKLSTYPCFLSNSSSSRAGFLAFAPRNPGGWPYREVYYNWGNHLYVLLRLQCRPCGFRLQAGAAPLQLPLSKQNNSYIVRDCAFCEVAWNGDENEYNRVVRYRK